MKKEIAQPVKMYSIGYYILPITMGGSNTYFCTECAMNEDDAKRMFLSHMPDNCRINTISEITIKR